MKKFAQHRRIKMLSDNVGGFLFVLFIVIFTACTSTLPTEKIAEPTATLPSLAERLDQQLTRTTTAVSPSPTVLNTPTPKPSVVQTTPTRNPSMTPAGSALEPTLVVYTTTPVASPTLTPVPKVKITYHAVNIRRGPRVDYPIIGFLYEGDVVEIISIHGGQDGWYYIQSPDGIMGWVGVSVVEPANLFNIALIPTAATIPATSTATPTNTPTPTVTFTPPPKPPQPKPSSTPIALPPTATINPYP